VVTLKPWILYVILAWSPNPILPEGQKTVMLHFQSFDECTSIANQVDMQIKDGPAPFRVKALACYPCTEIFKDGCPVPAHAKGLKPQQR
jgi:hypothetical protein